MPDLLLEVGLEEIPARMIAAAERELVRRVSELLVRERLAEAEAEPSGYSTPRRLAVLARGVLARQPDREEELTGPAWKVAFRDGEPTAAAQAFAKKAGVEIAALRPLTTPKGEYVSATVSRPGRPAAEVLAGLLPKEIAAISWPKTMYWRREKPERFVRPLRWLVCLLDQTIVPIEFAGIRAGNLSYGHRILHGDAPVELRGPAEYLSRMESAFVLADVPARRERIRKALDAAARGVAGARWREDEPLVEQVTNLTEWPTVVLGGFESAYLELPEEVLVTVMRDHQKYFAIEDSAGKLAPHFLAVLNTEVDAEGLAIIRHGNERVLRARFNDARFFWNYDQKTPLVSRLDLLKAVTFQKELGSYFAKTQINLRTAKALAAAVAVQGVELEHGALDQAVLLAKADLTTELVKEFTELQGVIGGLYARAQGLGEQVASAISAQYLPASTEDPVPAAVEGQILGLADRAATIVEMFAIGLEPSGSKDPFALRRAGNGVVKILAEGGLPLTLADVQRLAEEQSQRAKPNSEAVAAFLKDRLDFYLREVRGFAYDVVNAVLAAGVSTVPDAIARAQALTQVRGSEDMVAISTAFKRIKNILRQAGEQNGGFEGGIAAGDLKEPAEQRLHAEALKRAPQMTEFQAARNYAQALECVAALRPAVDQFFDTVMVMAPEADLRRNRLALIASVLQSFSRIADFSEIAAARPGGS
ncbi:MAG TPA: glycine--tRNA ligase subunit beta [Acidobacteriaceae bacterium]|nr:glycine--tRNA ligase subunit beta [Acidobacteriaceae bacterium]